MIMGIEPQVLLVAVMPTVAVLGLVIKLGELIRTVKEVDATLKVMVPVVSDLKAWREATASFNSDLLERIRRIEARYLEVKNDVRH